MKCSGGLCKEGATTAGKYCIHNDFDAHVFKETHIWAAFQIHSKALCSARKCFNQWRSHQNETQLNKQANKTNNQTKHLNTKAN